MTAALPHIVGGIGKAGGRLLGADLLDDLPRHPHHKGIVRDDLAFGHKRTSPDDAVFTHNTVVEQGGVHPNQGTVSHGAPVDKGTVAHGHVFAQRDRPARITVEHRIILHIGVLAQGQGAVVPAQTEEPGPSTTSPSTVALGATNTAPLSRGTFPPKGNNIVKNHLSLFRHLWYSFI